MTTAHQALLDQIIEAIENDNLVLPTLPDVAIKIQDLIDDPNVSADQIVMYFPAIRLFPRSLSKPQTARSSPTKPKSIMCGEPSLVWVIANCAIW